MNKHLWKVLLGVYFPTITAYLFLTPFCPVVGLSGLLIAFFTVTIGGFTQIYYAEETEFKLLYEKQIAAMEDVTKEKVEVYKKTIEHYKANPTAVKDETTTRKLVSELMKISQSAEKALKEKELEENDTLSL